MDWEKAATNFGLPGLMLVIIYALIRLWLSSNERIEAGKRAVELEKTKVEDKKADAMASALTSLSGKIDAHHTNDLQSHADMASGIAELHGKIDQALIDRTPVEMPVRRVTPPRGLPAETGYYPPARPKTQGGGR
jgi:hypothetical protein